MPKLVRDKIPEKIRSSGMHPVFHVERNDAFYDDHLKDKLQEEVTEYLASDSLEELADVLEVIDAMIAFKGIDRDELQRVKAEKTTRVGAFRDRIILDNVAKSLDSTQ